MTDVKSIWTSKTLWLNLVGIGITLLEAGNVVNMLPAGVQMYIPAVLGFLNIVVRTQTNQAVALIPPKR